MFELIVCIINRGFSDTVRTAARGSGARGGTILHAKGTGSHEAERFFGITIQPEKEIVLILVPKEIRSDVMSAIASSCGLATEGGGIAFSLPVEDVLGLVPGRPEGFRAEAAGEQGASESE